MADRARNTDGLGKAATLNVLTPIIPGDTWLVGVVLWALRRFTTPVDLALLSFVHWAVIPRTAFPQLDPRQPKEQLNHDYLIFLSAFTGPWGPYIDAFADVLFKALDAVWSWTVAYPGANPVTGLKTHIIRNRIESDHFYSAYPGASVRDVRDALIIAAALEDLAKLQGLPAVEFAEEYHRIVLRLQNRLGPFGPLPC